MAKLKPTLLCTIALAACSVSAYDTGYVFHFNGDENTYNVSPDPAISLLNWNLVYGASGTNAIGDANIASGFSIGGSNPTLFRLPQFSNSTTGVDRGFIYASGSGSSSTGFAPEAFFFYTEHLETVNVIQGEKADGLLQTDWGTPAFPPTQALSSIRVSDLIELYVLTRPRNLLLTYRIAFKVKGTWYVDTTGRQNSTLNWEAYSLDVQNASVYPLPFVPGSSLDLDVSDNGSVTVASLDPSAVVEGYGVYVDTESFKGTSDDGTSSWARIDGFFVNAALAPPMQNITINGGTFSADIDTLTGISYQLIRDTTLPGSFSTSIGSPVSGTGETIPLQDTSYGSVGSDKVFYKVEAKPE